MPSELDRCGKAQAALLSFDVVSMIAEDMVSEEQAPTTLSLLPTSRLSRFIPRSIDIRDGLYLFNLAYVAAWAESPAAKAWKLSSSAGQQNSAFFPPAWVERIRLAPS